jgi:hypothetical protein
MGDGLIAHLFAPCKNCTHSSLQICSTLSEWECIAERFENATHYSEKRLHKLLKNHISPAVVADLQVGEATGVCLSVPLTVSRKLSAKNKKRSDRDSSMRLLHTASVRPGLR